MSTLRATNIKNPDSGSNNIVLSESGGVVISGVTTITTLNASEITGVSGGMVVSGVTTVSAGSTSAPSITPSGDENTGIFFPSADTIAFGEGGSEAARFDSSGRLLLGTNSARSVPGWAPGLQIEGTSFTSSSFSLMNNGADSNPAFITFGKSRGGALNSNTIVNNGDYLGQIAFYGADGSGTIKAAEINALVDGTPGSNDMPGRLVFSTTADSASSPTERMRIGNNGYVKASNAADYINAGGTYHEFNTNESDYTLQARSTNANPAGVHILYSGSSPNATGNNFLVCDDATTSRAVIRSNGGLANFSANNVNLSDINVKKDIISAAGTWDCLKDWEIVNFRYKDQPDDADLNMGVIAQQVAINCPEVVTVFQESKEATDDQPAQEERIGVKEQQMMWMAIKALQEAQTRIETLEASNTDLAARVAALESN